jgi:flagellar hook-associated protein 2
LRDSLRTTILGAESSGTFARLAEVGVEFESTGKISIDSDRLSAALDASPAAVQQLFADRFNAIEDLIGAYTDAGGLVADVRERIDSQVARLGSRIDVLESQLAIRRAALQREFIAADRAMSQLNSQGSSLAQLGGQYRLF